MVLRELPPKSHTGQEEPVDLMPVNRRLAAFRAILALVFLIFAVRLWQLQIVEGGTFKNQADLNLLTVLDVEAKRGLIYARGGELMARNAPSYEVSIVPAYLPDDESEEMAVYQRLSDLLDILKYLAVVAFLIWLMARGNHYFIFKWIEFNKY